MFTSFVNQFKANVLEPKINQRMDEVGKAWVVEASRLVPVRTGFLKSTLGYSYNASTKTLVLHADAKYALMVEMGHKTPSGGLVPAHPFMRPALSVVPRIWRGSLGNALTGHSVELQAVNTPSKHQAGYAAHAKGKTRGAKLVTGRGRFS